MDWQSEGDLSTFLRIVKDERAHWPAVQGLTKAETKWDRVRQALVDAFPERNIQASCTLQKYFLKLCRNAAAKNVRGSEALSKNEKALHALMQDVETTCENTFKDREAVIATVVMRIVDESGPLF